MKKKGKKRKKREEKKNTNAFDGKSKRKGRRDEIKRRYFPKVFELLFTFYYINFYVFSNSSM